MVHDLHDIFLVPPSRFLNAFNFTTHHNDLTRWNQLATTVRGTQMLRDAGRRHIPIQRLGHAVHQLGALSGRPGVGWVGGEDEVSVQINDQRVGRSGEQGTAFRSDSENVWARFLHQILRMTSVNDRDVESAPLVYAHHVADCLGCNSEHCRVVRDKNDLASRGDCSFEYTNDIRDAQATEQGPHGKILEATWRGGELVAQSVVLHVDSHKIVQSGCREAEDARDLLRVEEVGRLVPVNPHAAKVVAKEVVKWVARQETQAVWDPVGFARVVEVVWLCAPAEVTNSLRALVVGAGPDAKCDTIQGV